MRHRWSRAFSRDEVRAQVIPVYMGLIKQIDDQLGVLLQFMEDQGLMENTMIVFTSDHGDYLGDHWLGEKELFHEPSVKVPLIIFDPSDAADQARGTACDKLVESIDLLPTFIDAQAPMPPSTRTAWRAARWCRSCAGSRCRRGGNSWSANTTIPCSRRRSSSPLRRATPACS